MSKQEWIQNNLKPGEEYAGILLGYNDEPDYHVIVSAMDIDVEYLTAARLAVEARADLPSVRELMHIYLNRPDLFIDKTIDPVTKEALNLASNKTHRSTYWTKELCAAPAFSSSSETKEEYVVSFEPGTLAKSLRSFGRGYNGTPFEPSKIKGYVHNVIAIRRVAVESNEPFALSNQTITPVLNWLKSLEEKLQSMGYRCEGSASTWNANRLARNNAFEWYGRYIGKDSAVRYRITVEPVEASAGLSQSAWTGSLVWIIRTDARNRLFTSFSGKTGQGVPTEAFQQSMIDALTELEQQTRTTRA